MKSAVAVLSCGAYLAIAVVVRGGLPFVRFPAFRFPTSEGQTAVPLVLADGVPARLDAFEAFGGLTPADVDVEHRGVPCGVEHLLHENRAWLADHLAPPSEPPGPVRIEIGLRVLALDATGALTDTPRVDAAGWARRRP